MQTADNIVQNTGTHTGTNNANYTAEVIPLSQFVNDFKDGLLDAVAQQNPPLYADTPNLQRDALMDTLKRVPFPEQKRVIQAVSALLLDKDDCGAIINAEMGTGKTIMGCATAAVCEAEGLKRTLVLSPPHLVYKWRREIKETVPNAKVWVLNGPDTLLKLMQLKESLGSKSTDDSPEFYILGRVRMRMGFNWRPAFATKRFRFDNGVVKLAVCPCCGAPMRDSDGHVLDYLNVDDKRRSLCEQCDEPLWTLYRTKHEDKTRLERVKQALCQLPTIGPKTADRLINAVGCESIADMLGDNVYELINLIDASGKFVFSDAQAKRLERAMARTEFSFGQGGFQPTEYIKRHLPKNYFGLMIVDEGHEYKNGSSAQGQAMGVLCSQVSKVLLLTGTLMGGYADDLFYLLMRLFPTHMIDDGFVYSPTGSLSGSSMAFLRQHGILKDIYKETADESHKTARGSKAKMRTVKAPGFGPKGIARYVMPFTAFLKLRDIGGNVLPSYDEHYIDVEMTATQSEKYFLLRTQLERELKDALRQGDKSLLGVVVNALLAWPDTCFRPEKVMHPRSKKTLALVASVFDEDTLSPKEIALVNKCKEEKAKDRRTLVYTTYSGKRDTCARLKTMLERNGLKVAVLRSSVDTAVREDWILDQVDRGIDVMICNPELVKTGLDLLQFPTIVFMQTGYNVYTILQAARRSWRIGQKRPVEVFFFGYSRTVQTNCLQLMAKKIAVAQSTSGDMPDTGLDVLNQDSDSIEVALAKSLSA